MKLVYFVFGSSFILLGVTAIWLGKYLSVERILRKQASFNIIDEKNYIKYCRILLYVLGLFLILFSSALFFLLTSSLATILFSCIFAIITILLITVIFSLKLRKYTESTNQLNNKK